MAKGKSLILLLVVFMMTALSGCGGDTSTPTAVTTEPTATTATTTEATATTASTGGEATATTATTGGEATATTGSTGGEATATTGTTSSTGGTKAAPATTGVLVVAANGA